MTSNALRRALLATLFILTPSAALPKCPFETYEVQIQVRNYCTRAPVPGAHVLLFENGERYAVDLRTQDGQAEETIVTDAVGSVSARFWFSTSSGSGFFGDRCNRQLKQLDIVVAADGYRAERRTLRGSKLRGPARDSAVQLPGPTVELRPLDDSACCPPTDSAPVATGRLTLRCSGQIPGVRPGFAAELKFR